VVPVRFCFGQRKLTLMGHWGLRSDLAGHTVRVRYPLCWVRLRTGVKCLSKVGPVVLVTPECGSALMPANQHRRLLFGFHVAVAMNLELRTRLSKEILDWFRL
jgi:hypothetical protein